MGRAVTLLVTVAVSAGLVGVLAAQERPRRRLVDSAPAETAGQAGGQAPAADARPGELAAAAAAVQAAWLAHDVGRIVAGSPQLVVQLPGTDPSAPLGARQAAALLADFLAAAREVELSVRGAQEVEPDRGHVEMLRRYRIEGTQDVRAQNVFLGYRRGRQGWILVELRAIEP